MIDFVSTHHPPDSAHPNPWTRLALDLPRFHPDLTAGDALEFRDRLTRLPAVTPADLSALPDEAARLTALDVLMIEATIRRHDLHPGLPPDVGARLDAACHAVAARLEIQPIIAYPLYIRFNPKPLDQIRRFTPLEAEFRFIRMHRVIEDRFDEVIAQLQTLLDSPDWRAELGDIFPALKDSFRLINRTMAGFRDPERMPVKDFTEGFRPYFASVLNPATGEVVLEGPSGLQSPTYRMIAMLVGYRDALLDGWTTRIAAYHEPAVRTRLAELMASRDAGRSLAAMVERTFGLSGDLPRFHPDYAHSIPALAAMAKAGGYVSADVPGILAAHGVILGAWPKGAQVPAPLPVDFKLETHALDSARTSDPDTVARLTELEAMLFGFHLEHIATTVVQIGHVRGTGGTSGAEFLAMATFRRAFPWLWLRT